MNLDELDLEKMSGPKLGAVEFKKYTNAEEGEVLVTGIYKGNFPNKFNEDKPNHKFEIQGKKHVILPASGHLDYLLREVEVGDLVRIVYEGKETLTKGKYSGKPVNNFSLELLMKGETPKEIKASSTPTLDNLE